MATYSATKFAIVGFSQALRSELMPHNVRVVSLLPSLTETDMVREFDRFLGVQPSQPEDVAEAMVKGLERGQTEILVGWQSHAAVWTQRLAPWFLERMVNLANPANRKRHRTANSFRP